MSESPATPSSPTSEPPWMADLFDEPLPQEGHQVVLRGTPFSRQRGILRAESLTTETQSQTSDSFGFKWNKRDTFESAASLARMRAWLIERYGDVEEASWWTDYDERPLVVDAGCGAGMSAIELFGERLSEIRYLGVDISNAVDVAAKRFGERGVEAGFLQADLAGLPLAENSVDVIFSEGVLHHTDSTELALKSLARLLRPGGRFLFYVYRKKGPIREFTDDYIREELSQMEPSAAWEALRPLTELGKQLGELDVELDIQHPIALLEIPAGRISLQRFFYWHIFKAFHHEDLAIDELHHINYDWYAPANAHRQTPEQVRRWCQEAELDIEHEALQKAGITIVARKR